MQTKVREPVLSTCQQQQSFVAPPETLQFVALLLDNHNRKPPKMDLPSLSDLRQDLRDPTKSKTAAYKIKLLISAQNIPSSDLQFFSEFFDLFDILEEKQSHIIQPVLKKLRIFEDSWEELEKCEWYLVLLGKMMGHDNRDIAREGLLRFLLLGVQPPMSEVRETLRAFLVERALPLIRDHVGWVFPEAEQHFEASARLSVFLKSVLSSSCERLRTVLSFLVEEGIALSPAAVHFLVKSLDTETDVLSGDAVSLAGNFEECIECSELIVKVLLVGLTTVDAFLKREVEGVFIRILVKELMPVIAASNECIRRTLAQILNICGCCSWESFRQGLEISSEVLQCVFVEAASLIPGDIKELDVETWIRDEGVCHPGKTSFLQDLTVAQIRGWMRIIVIASASPTLLNAPGKITTVLESEVLATAFLSHRYRGMQDISAELFKIFRQIHSEESFKEWIVLNVFPYCRKVLQTLVDLVLISDDPVQQWKPSKFLKIIKLIECLSIKIKCATDFYSGDLDVQSYDDILQQIIDYLKASKQNCDAAKFLLVELLECIPFSNPTLEDILLITKTLLVNSTGDGVILGLIWSSEMKAHFRQKQFSGLAMIYQFYSRNERCVEQLGPFLDESEFSEVFKAVVDITDQVGLGGVTKASNFVKSLLDVMYCSEFRQYRIFSTSCTVTKQLSSFIDLAWNLTFELRKTEAFWNSLEELTQLISHPYFYDKDILTEYSAKIFEQGETVYGLPLVLIRNLSTSVQRHADYLRQISSPRSSDASPVERIIAIFLDATLNGIALPKNIRVIYSLWEYLRATGDQELYNSCTFVKLPLMRLTAIQSVISFLNKAEEFRTPVLNQVLKYLLEKLDENSNKRYFGNSLLHRKKQRILQFLLCIQCYLTQEQSLRTFHRLMKYLSDETPQPSVRYLTEWCLIRFLSIQNSLWDNFFLKSIEFWTHRIGFGTYFSSMCLHVCNQLTDSDSSLPFFQMTLEYLAQLVVGHHATVRAYAQACFVKVYERVSSLSGDNFHCLSVKYEVLYNSLKAAESFCVGTSAKIMAALSDDFYLQSFHPAQHFTEEVVFIYLPQLSEVAGDEIPTKWCIRQIQFELSGGNVCDVESLYAKWKKSVWHLKNAPVGDRELGEECPTDTLGVAEKLAEQNNFQKKINPWKTLGVSEKLMDSIKEEAIAKKRTLMDDGLVVVASLVDRIPNLGGLCRSCEIFGVSKYVIPSLKIIEDQQFQNLAVSSHNWVNITEVPPKDMESFLNTYKSKGYRILGIEQAQESKRLDKFQFPKQSLLLLGNEKYGIPSNLLHLVDDCLEIPQVGVIRSLNVHVTGALCIWQYSTQHAFNNS